jgi:excisionase family DNA binding protein
MGKLAGPKIHIWSDRAVPGSGEQSDPTMTLREVARYLGVHQLTIYRAIKAGAKLGQFKVGRVWAV